MVLAHFPRLGVRNMRPIAVNIRSGHIVFCIASFVAAFSLGKRPAVCAVEESAFWMGCDFSAKTHRRGA